MCTTSALHLCTLTWYKAHCSDVQLKLYTAHFVLNSEKNTLYIYIYIYNVYSALYNVHCILHIVTYTLHTTQYARHNELCILLREAGNKIIPLLHTAQYTKDTAHWKPTKMCISLPLLLAPVKTVLSIPDFLSRLLPECSVQVILHDWVRTLLQKCRHCNILPDLTAQRLCVLLLMLLLQIFNPSFHHRITP